MDSIALVKDSLTEEIIERGKELVEYLDQIGLSVKAALWHYNSELNTWRLVLGIGEVDVDGPREVYKIVQKALLSVGLSDLGIHLTDVHVFSPHHRLVQALRRFMRTGKRLVRSRVTHNSIGGQYIEDALIYRVH